MAEQTNIFDVDNTGRKATRLGLSHDYEIVVRILEAAKRLHVSLGMYQIGIVDCEMKGCLPAIAPPNSHGSGATRT